MAMLDRLEATITDRLSGDPAASYVARLGAGGAALAGKKLGEEAVELVIAGLGDDRAAVIAEAADLLFHMGVLLGVKGVSFTEVEAELARREGVSGLVEKAGRGDADRRD